MVFSQFHALYRCKLNGQVTEQYRKDKLLTS